MAYDRRAEVERILQEDDSRLGETFRGDKAGLTPREQAELAGVATHGYVYNNRTMIRALMGDEISEGTELAAATARKVRSLLLRVDLSTELRADWERLEERLTLHVEEERAANEAKEVEAVKATAEAESLGKSGIYVYTLPHYLKHLVDPESGKTYLKVGRSEDVNARVFAQGRSTELPEDPVLLRIYPTDDPIAEEHVFHTWLRKADHNGARTRRGGREWFLTSEKFLDHIAESEGLDCIKVNGFEDIED